MRINSSFDEIVLNDGGIFRRKNFAFLLASKILRNPVWLGEPALLRSNTGFLLSLTMFAGVLQDWAATRVIPPTVPGTIDNARDIPVVFLGHGVNPSPYLLGNYMHYIVPSG